MFSMFIFKVERVCSKVSIRGEQKETEIQSVSVHFDMVVYILSLYFAV
jgi:hypothetical protein